jgi:endonuclease-3
MKRAEKAERIAKILGELHPDPPIPLRHRDPFTLLVAVVLSAQTTDARVNLVTPALFARADTPEKMAKLAVAEIHELIRTCGLAPAKAKAIAGLSKLLVEKHAGKVPRTFEELEALPGVGHKTASVVMAQAFGIPTFPVDTHIHRLAQRWGLSDGSSVERTERDLKSVFPEDAWIRLHVQIILFGREHCPALRHERARCPICSWAGPGKPARATPTPPAIRASRRTSSHSGPGGVSKTSSGVARATAIPAGIDRDRLASTVKPRKRTTRGRPPVQAALTTPFKSPPNPKRSGPAAGTRKPPQDSGSGSRA